MKIFKFLLILCISMLTITSCSKSDSLNKKLDSISETFYYSDDPFVGESFRLYGTWQADHRTQSGVAGVSIVAKDFDHLIIKPNGIFGIVTDDNLLTTGKIEITDSENIRIQFIPEEDDLDIDILRDSNTSIFQAYREDDNTLELVYGTSSTVLSRIE